MIGIKQIIRIVKMVRIYLMNDGDKRAEAIKKMGFLGRIGKNCYIARDVHFGSEPELISIGNNVWLTAGVRFITHDGSIHMLARALNKKMNPKLGRITIKDNCFIGVGSIILPGVTIGPNSIVGAGSVVTKDVPENKVFAGNPAREICSLNKFIEKNNKIDKHKIYEIMKEIKNSRRNKILKRNKWK